MSADGLQDSSSWWNKARAALGRAFGAVQVRAWEPDMPGTGGATRASEATAWAAPGTGTHEQNWLFQTDTHRWPPLAALAGGGGLDAAALPCSVSPDAVPRLGEQGVRGGDILVPLPSVQSADMGTGARRNVTVLPLPLDVSGGQALPVPVALLAPPVRAVPVALAGTGRGGLQTHGQTGIPAFAAPRTARSLARITRVPLLRRRAVLPANADIADGFLAERRALAAACGATVEEVKLLGSFPQIPLALVQQMAVTPDGEALRLWLRPEALASGAGWTAARVTVVLGRRRLTGETVRAVLPEPRAAARKQ